MTTKYFTKSLTVSQYDGTTKRLKFRGKTPEEAEAKLQEAKLKYQLGVLAVNGSSTFGSWVEDWLETYVIPNKGTEDVKQIKRILNNYFLPYIGDIRMADLKPVHFQSCCNKMADKSKSYIRKCRMAVNDIIRKAAANQLMARDFSGDIIYPSGFEGSKRALNPKEREIFKKVVYSHQNGLFFALMYGCGLRDNEARALQWVDVDLKQNILHVRRAIKRDTGKPGEPKSKAGIRDIPIPPWLADMLRNTKKEALYVCPNYRGSYISTDRIQRAWNSLKNQMYKEFGVPTYRNQIVPEEAALCSVSELTPYCLRHTYCTMLAENNMPLKTAQYLMGHSSIEMTARVYTHVTSKMIDDAKDIIDTMWEAM